MGPNDALAHVARLSDHDFLVQVKDLAQREREATVALIVHLAELDERGLYLAEGYPSLFKYCTDVLHLSEHAAYNRIETARAVRRFPMILEHLAAGWVNLFTVRRLAPQLTLENHQDVLALTRYKSKCEIEELIARLHPQPPVPDVIRKLPARTPEASLAPLQVGAQEPPGLSRELLAKLREAQALLRHQIPDGDLEKLFDRALAALLANLRKQKVAATERPHGSRSQASAAGPDSLANSRHIPAAVRRAVWARDGGRCAFVSTSGRRCAEAGCLEFHHILPYAHGGPSTVDNIALRCRAHNGYEAEYHFGRWGTAAMREEPEVYTPGASAVGAAASGAITDSFRNEFEL